MASFAYDCIVIRAHPDTLVWLQERFSVSPVFLQSIAYLAFDACRVTGNASFSALNERGKVVAIGMYLLSFFQLLDTDRD
jgi:hypothetical protein